MGRQKDDDDAARGDDEIQMTAVPAAWQKEAEETLERAVHLCAAAAAVEASRKVIEGTTARVSVDRWALDELARHAALVRG